VNVHLFDASNFPHQGGNKDKTRSELKRLCNSFQELKQEIGFRESRITV
jgi:hypothetical protein